MTGTLINIATILIGSTIGLLLGERLPDRIRQTVMAGIGLITFVIGFQMALETQNVIIPLASIIIGSVLGEWCQIEQGLTMAGEWLRKRLTPRKEQSDGRFVQGFVTATVLFCVGPMTVMGAIQDGLSGDFSLLATKSVLDGFSSLALASAFGMGVLTSILPVLVIQGGIALLAGYAQQYLTDSIVLEASAVGGVMIIAIGLGLLDIKKIRVANMLPALFVAAGLVAALSTIGFGGY